MTYRKQAICFQMTSIPIKTHCLFIRLKTQTPRLLKVHLANCSGMQMELPFSTPTRIQPGYAGLAQISLKLFVTHTRYPTVNSPVCPGILFWFLSVKTVPLLQLT